MKKKESTFLNMVLSLFLVTLISGITLSLVYNATKKPIALTKLNSKLKAIQAVVPDYNNKPTDEQYSLSTDDKLNIEFYPAKKNDNLVGTAIKSYSKIGYNGLIWLMVGIRNDGRIFDIFVLEHKETPGLGDKMKNPEFINQFINKHPEKNNLTVKKDGGGIDAITAATITSRAFCDAVQRAYKTYRLSEKNNLKTNE